MHNNIILSLSYTSCIAFNIFLLAYFPSNKNIDGNTIIQINISVYIILSIVSLLLLNIYISYYKFISFFIKILLLLNIILYIYSQPIIINIQYALYVDTVYFIFTNIIHDFYYKEKERKNKLIGLNRISNQTDISEECSICIEYYKPLQDVHIFRCNHKFHLECSKKLIITHSKCPLCRQLII
jgi:hypothetical protein